MANSTVTLRNNSNSRAAVADFTSMMLRRYIEILEKNKKIQVLDMGPVCEENIMFFAQRVKRLYVCDMFLRLDRNRRKGLPASKVWNHLDYPPQSFAGIHLWDLGDHLDDHELSKLVELCHTMLKPHGMLMVITLAEKSAQPIVNSFVIQHDYRLNLRPQTHIDLPLYSRSNRELIALLTPFNIVKSFIYRNKIREFLFQRT